METDFYDKVVVKIKYKGSEGSGILISDTKKNNSYLISAWHCFYKHHDIDYREIEIYRQEKNELKLLCLNFQDKISDTFYKISENLKKSIEKWLN